MTEKITINQENRIIDLFRDAVRALGLSKDEAQEIISKGNIFQGGVKDQLKKLTITDKRFGFAVVEFEITIPSDYNHDTQIDQLAEKVKKLKTTYYYNEALTSKNFAKATNKLVPGKTYKVKIIPILETVKSEDCLTFLSKQNAILVGGQGVTLVYNLAKDKFPKGKGTVSFDQKDALWKDADGRHRVPSVDAYSDGAFYFHLGYFEGAWDGGYCLLCLCDK